MTKTHTITGKRNGKEFTKKVEVTYEDNKPKFINKIFGVTGYIHYEELFDWNNLDEDGQPEFLGDSETPSSIVGGYRDNCLFEDFKIIK